VAISGYVWRIGLEAFMGKKQMLWLSLFLFMVFYGAWSLGADIVVLWRGGSLLDLANEACWPMLFTLIALIAFRLKGDWHE